MQEELALLARARALEEAALIEVHDRYYDRIFRYISFRVSDSAVAEDLASEVFTRLLGALRDRTAPQNTLRGWLYAVASRVVSDHYRQLQRAQEVELTDMIPDHHPTLEDSVGLRIRSQRLRQAMTELTEEQQNVLALRFGFGLRIKEVAETIGKSEGAVKQLQLRAIAALSKKLAPGVTVP